MVSSTTTRAICVWLDETEGGSTGGPAWIVSLDDLDDCGRAERTTTLDVFGFREQAGDEGDRDEDEDKDAVPDAMTSAEAEAEAWESARTEARRRQLPLYANAQHGPARLVESYAAVRVVVMNYDSGERIGRVEMPAAEWERYEAGEHPAYQWPQGIARAEDALDANQIEELDVAPDTVVYLE